MTFKEFANKEKLKILVESVTVRRDSAFDNMEADHWIITLINNKSRYSFWYSTGYGHRVKNPSRVGVMDRKLPAIHDVLKSLHVDISELPMPFEEWAQGFGYDSDSIRAHKTWEACNNTLQAVKKFFTARQFVTFLDCEE